MSSERVVAEENAQVESLRVGTSPRPGSLPVRRGPGLPAASPHGVSSLQRVLLARLRLLDGVTEAPTRLSILGARALSLAPEHAGAPPEVFLIGGEFAVARTVQGDWSLSLPWRLSDELIAKGWGELRPVAGEWGESPIATAVYGPRDEEELEVVWEIALASYEHARGVPDYSPDEWEGDQGKPRDKRGRGAIRRWRNILKSR